MSKKSEILFASSIFFLIIIYAFCIIYYFKDLLVLFNSKPTLQITILFLFLLLQGLGLFCISITVFTNVLLKKCDCCKGRGFVKKVILASQHPQNHEREYHFCFKCRLEESWRDNEEFAFVRGHLIIYVSLI